MVLSIADNSFPANAGYDILTLDDFYLKHAGKKGSATVSVSLGGKVFKATVKCK